jgi:hypothetical protein
MAAKRGSAKGGAGGVASIAANALRSDRTAKHANEASYPPVASRKHSRQYRPGSLRQHLPGQG